MGLDAHLILPTRPQPCAENVVLWKNYRITVLKEGLFRIEEDREKVFFDGATQQVLFRDFGKVPFAAAERDGCLEIGTNACRLVLSERFASSYIMLGDRRERIGNGQNLRGTYRTLDGCDGSMYRNVGWSAEKERLVETGKPKKIRLGAGVCSRNGVAVLDDGASLALTDGMAVPRRRIKRDVYVFAYGNDYRAAVRAFYDLCGATPMIPRYALGNWWSRYHAYTEREYLALMNAFKRERIPFTVATVDMDWHYSEKIAERFGFEEKGRTGEEYGDDNGWTGYSWNEDYFPDYKRFLAALHKENYHVTLNLHPSLGVRWWETPYRRMATAMGIDPEEGRVIPFEIENPVFLNAYFRELHKPYEADGVDFWWIDWQQGTTSGLAGLDPLWSLNHYHYLDNALNHTHGLILSRYCDYGAHRYPLGFSGDTYMSWKTLDYIVYFTVTASNIGYTWWSHDIGGHMLGKKESELFVRFVQFGVFSPVNRLHCSNGLSMDKTPWVYPNGAGQIVADWLRLRHALIPFLYSAAYRTHTEGAALVEPMYYEYPQEENAYRMKNQYLFGGSLLVAPVTKKSVFQGMAATDVWIPKGMWTDFFTGDEYEGGAVRTLYRNLNHIPVLVRAGGIVPLSRDEGNGCGNPRALEFMIYAGNGSYELFEDDEDGKSAFTELSLAQTAQTLRLALSTRGDRSVVPQERTVCLNFANVYDGTVCVTKDGLQTPFEIVAANTLVVKLIGYDPAARYEVTVVCKERTAEEKLFAKITRILQIYEADNAEKDVLLAQCRRQTTCADMLRLIASSWIDGAVKRAIEEPEK